jgi:hypothetical protein
VVVAFMGLVSTWLPFLSSQIMRAGSRAGISVAVAGAAAGAGEMRCGLWRAVPAARAEFMPFILALNVSSRWAFAGLVAGDLAEPAAARPDHLEGRGAAGESGLRARGHADHAARRCWLHVVGRTPVFRGKVAAGPAAITELLQPAR